MVPILFDRRYATRGQLRSLGIATVLQVWPRRFVQNLGTTDVVPQHSVHRAAANVIGDAGCLRERSHKLG